MVVLALGCTGLTGCVEALPVLQHLARAPETTVSPAGEDGTRYIAVEGRRLTSPRTLRGRWNRTARETCAGEYQTLSDSGASRRQGGVVRSRIHEGYIRCLAPDGSEPSVEGPTVEDATARRSAKTGTRRASASTP